MKKEILQYLAIFLLCLIDIYLGWIITGLCQISLTFREYVVVQLIVMILFAGYAKIHKYILTKFQ
jgi:hypothetical protein